MTLNNTFNVVCTEKDEDFVLIFRFVVGGWLSIITCTLGLLCNTFSIIVLVNKRMRTFSTNVYLIALAVANLLWLILFFIFYAIRFAIIIPHFISKTQNNSYNNYDEIFYQLSPYIIPLMNTLELCITYYTVAVSADRYLHVSMGINTAHYFTVRNSLRIILLLTIFSIMFIIPYWFKFHVVKQIDIQNRTHHEVLNEFIVVYIMPFLILIFMNILTARRLTQYYDEHRRLLSTSIRQMAMLKINLVYYRRHYHVTIMLIAVVLLFLVCRIPILINQIYEVQYFVREKYISPSNLDFQCQIQHIFDTFANFMQTLNSIGNLVIYLLCCQNFRETSKYLFKTLSTYT
ncbi:unnamed protein product, partial [Rotaria magnacalcarata]